MQLMNRRTDMQQALDLIKEHLTFDQDIKVHVFETIIRVLGGLTSGHILLSREPSLVPGYEGMLLSLVSNLVADWFLSVHCSQQ